MVTSQRKGKPVQFRKNEGKKYLTKNGKEIHLLNPEQKSRRYAKELKVGCNIYTGEKLTNTQKAWRAGRLAERNDSARCYNSKKK